MARIKENDVLKTVDGEDIKVTELKGEGGQGLVYKVQYQGKSYALKWYKKPQSSEFYNNLCENVKNGSPAKTFLWPLAVTEKDSDGCFGYVMKLCPQTYKSLSNYLLNRINFKSLKAMVNAAIEIAASFRKLHNDGYSYQDLNDGNFFIEPQSGHVLICDNDNIAPNLVNLGILGKPRYMAPEIVDGSREPNKYSDYYSLAVILFLLMFRNHPLEGAKDNCDDDKNDLNLYCKHPVFIYDETDLSNRPKPDVHTNVINLWPLFPKPFRRLFIKAFSKPLMCERGAYDRVTDLDWLKALRDLKNSIVVCPNCHEETFFNTKKEEYVCKNCEMLIKRPPVLKLEKKLIPLQVNNAIYSYDIDPVVDITIDTINDKVGVVIQNPKKATVWGLKNLSNITWYRRTPKGCEHICKPNEVVTIVRQNKIKFGTKAEGSLL